MSWRDLVLGYMIGSLVMISIGWVPFTKTNEWLDREEEQNRKLYERLDLVMRDNLNTEDEVTYWQEQFNTCAGARVAERK